jgi:hypothetical protein
MTSPSTLYLTLIHFFILFQTVLSQICPAGLYNSDKWFSAKTNSCISELECENNVKTGDYIKGGSKELIKQGKGYCGTCELAFKFCAKCENNEASVAFPFLNCKSCRASSVTIKNLDGRITACYNQEDCVENYGRWIETNNGESVEPQCLPCEGLFPNCLHCNSMGCLLCKPQFKRKNVDGVATECILERPEGFFPVSNYSLDGIFRGQPLKNLQEFKNCPSSLTNCLLCELFESQVYFFNAANFLTLAIFILVSYLITLAIFLLILLSNFFKAVCRQCEPGYFISQNGCESACPASLSRQNPAQECPTMVPKNCYHARNEKYCLLCQKEGS